MLWSLKKKRLNSNEQQKLILKLMDKNIKHFSAFFAYLGLYDMKVMIAYHNFNYAIQKYYSKTCLKPPLKKEDQKLVSRAIIAKCRSKILQNAPSKHSAILLTFI